MKKYNLLKSAWLLIVLLISFGVNAQITKSINYSPKEVFPGFISTQGSPQIVANEYRLYEIDVDAIQTQLVGIRQREDGAKGFTALISFPHPDGSMHEYKAQANRTLSAGLAEKFPEIKTYDAVDDMGRKVKWDITPKGLHVMILQPDESTIFIDPVIDGNNQYYIVYYKKDFTTDKVMTCEFDSDINNLKKGKELVTGTNKAFGTCELRTYRLALAATGEYTAFHGGTVGDAQAAQATTMNRVNGVYERDMAITMVIIANNDQIIYTNPGSDPYANGNPGTMINQNQANCDAVIGNGNYDIGHVFGTNSGGLAGLGVVCNNSNKARGVTGSSAPIGDPFDIDYVAHEMGHQFGANHTQNNPCNSVPATRMEPGSASTIMGYAGICPPNVQSNSDDHFHGISLEEIGIEIMSGGHTCEQITAIANNAPSITGTNGNVIIPANTPFALTAIVDDPDGDAILYCWEQMDNEASTQPPVPTSTGGPNFRSNSPTLDSTRYFPNLADLAAGISPTWEVIPSVSRTMNFRVTVRDQGLNVPGCNDHADVTVTTDAGSGPFVVTYPSATGIVWAGLSTETVTWDVANTDAPPVNCASVDILLSTDGGLTYPFTLASGVPNDGAETITVPNVATTTARVMVINSNGTFFDISDNDFEITVATNDYTMSILNSNASICQGDDTTYTIDIGSVGGYNDPVTLSVSGVPAGATSNFSTNPVTPAGSSILTISNTGAVTPGVYNLTITANSTSGTKTQNVTLTIADSNPAAVSLTSPANFSTGVPNPVTFNWTTSPSPGVTYEIDIATDAGYTAIVEQATALASPTYTSSTLANTTTYFWRVRAVTPCGQSAWSTTFEFTTNSCNTYVSTDVGQTTNVASFTSVINVTDVGTLSDVNLTLLDISHPWVGDLGATLTSPTGTTVQLFDGPGIPASQYGCNGDDINVSFDDAATATATDFENTCDAAVPTISGPFQSMDPMANFNGESITGTWTLTIFDSYTAGDDGTLNAWSLELCTTPPPCNDPDVPVVSGTTTICEGQSTTLSIANGNLNDATDWQWYEGSCGGTPVSSGTSITVSPTANTSYFVRGEGGCVSPGACQQVDVTVNPIYNQNQTASICNGDTYTYPDGSTGTVTETHTSTLTSVDGCDSIIVTDLTVNPVYNMNETASICQGQTYTYPDGSTGTVTETHTSTLTSVDGCDSIIVTDLTVSPTYNLNETASICQGQTYTYPDGSTGTVTETHTSILTSVDGCDSIIVTDLTVNPTYNLNETASICQGQTYTYPDGSTGTVTETHTSALTSVDGCDSIIVTSLTVNPTYNLNETASICQGQTYTYPDGSTGTVTETHTSTLTSVDGCDSIIVTDLTVNPVYNMNETASICQGQTYTYPDGSTGTVTETHTSTLTSVEGCDSIIVTDLTVYPTYNLNEAVSICTGNTYTYPDGSTGSTTETHTSLLTSVNGCDSIIVTDLTVVTSYNINEAVSICNGDTYTFPDGSTGNTTQTYTSTLVSSGGCDSIIVTDLTVNPTYNLNESASICQGQTYTYPDGSTGTVTETHTSTLTSVDGCDSIIVTDLTVNPVYNMNETA
ncbi:MAG: proprotein convertase P-domain-containing protein, partial [Crocinitomicaceae bacterium]|nr:proprotein convertase P-domain-containing protein [Crocinitomicaceae bacterium]